MSKLIHVINPNSNTEVTDGLGQALQGFVRPQVLDIHCTTLESGPFGIESQRDIDAVAPLLQQRVAEDKRSDAFVIACYSDPGLHGCRESTDKPVLGMAECGLLSALALGDQFGVIAIAHASIKRHVRHIRQLGLQARYAGEVSLDMSVAETASGSQTLRKIVEAGVRLRDEQGANVVVLGCAGMARHRKPAEQQLGIPVIEPVQAAVATASGLLLTG